MLYAVRVLAVSSLLVAASARDARAQRREAAQRWDERAVVQRAIEAAPDVARARASEHEARALTVFSQVSRIGNPTVGVRAMLGLPDSSAATYAVLVGVPFDLSGARQHYGDEARWALAEAEARLDVARNEASALARHAWVDVASGDASIALAAARLATADALLSAVRARLDAQSATALDLALAERERADAERDLVSARRERDAAAGRLREALALSPISEVEVAPLSSPAAPAGWTRERAAARAADHRRESSAYAAATRRLNASRLRLHHEATPPLFVAGEVEWQGYAQASIGFSAQWSLPLSQTNQGVRAVADAQARTQEQLRSLAARAAGHEGASAFVEIERRIEELRVLEERAIPAAERALTLTEALFRAGTVDSFRLLLARQQLFADRARRLDALRAAWHARIALDRATGEGAGS